MLSQTGNELKQATINYFGQDENSQPKGQGKELDAPQKCTSRIIEIRDCNSTSF